MWRAIVALSSLLIVSPAFAQAPGAIVAEKDEVTASASENREPTSKSYGHQILITDGLMIAGMVGGFSTGSFELGGAGVVGLHLGSPVVHLLHGNGGKAMGSLGLRTLPTLVAVGLSQADVDTEIVVAAGIITGLAVTAIDANFLAKEKVDPYLRYGTPTITPTRGGATVGLAGQF